MKKGITLILGNGFDLNMGMDTSYKSFFSFLKKSNFFEKYKNNSLLSYIYEQGEKENWYDFENVIKKYAQSGTFSRNLKLMECFQELMTKALSLDKDAYEDIANFPSMSNASIYVSNICTFAKNHIIYDFKQNDDVQKYNDYVNRDFDKYVNTARYEVSEAIDILKTQLKSFLNNAKPNEDNPMALWIFCAILGVFARGKKDLAYGILSHYSKEQKAYIFPKFNIVSFNYTNCIDAIVRTLLWTNIRVYLDRKVFGDSFYQIHGDLETKMVFGIDDDDNVPKEFWFLRKSEMIEENAKRRFNDILKDSDTIIILGHSINGIDFDYYKDLFTRAQDVDIYVLYKDEQAMQDIKNGLNNRKCTPNIKYREIANTNEFCQFCKGIAEQASSLIDKNIYNIYPIT